MSHQAATAAASDTLIYGTTEEPDTLNPQITQLATTYDLNAGVFDFLVRVDDKNNFIPDLATSWSVSSDNKNYTFHLRHGVKWADGQPFTSKDVIFTYQQVVNPKNNNSTTQGWDQVDRAQAPDNYTVIFHTKQVFAPFPLYAGATTGILPAHYFQHSSSFVKSGNYNRDPYDRKVFGTGPYMVSEWKTADHITLVPNPYYWGHKPSFKRIVFKIVPNSNTLLVQLRTGEVQVGGVEIQQVDQARSITGKKLVIRPGQSWFHVDLKQWGFLRDQKVRLALDYATPKDEIVQKVLHGIATPSYGDITPGSWAYKTNVVKHPFDLNKAAKILADDGFTKGPDGILRKNGQPFNLQLWYISGSATDEQVNVILKFYWSKLGIKIDLHQQNVSTIFGPSGPQFTKQMTGISYSWYNNNDPDDRLYWNSAQIPKTPTSPGGNVPAYFYPYGFQKQIDQLTNAGVTTLDRGKRRAIYYKIQDLLAEQVPVIFIYWSPLIYLQPSNLQGFDPNPFMYGLFWNAERWHF
jgi:peptide/nickel transport system substrate-binding protein